MSHQRHENSAKIIRLPKALHPVFVAYIKNNFLTLNNKQTRNPHKPYNRKNLYILYNLHISHILSVLYLFQWFFAKIQDERQMNSTTTRAKKAGG